MTTEQFKALIQNGIELLDHMAELVKKMDEACEESRTTQES